MKLTVWFLLICVLPFMGMDSDLYLHMVSHSVPITLKLFFSCQIFSLCYSTLFIVEEKLLGIFTLIKDKFDRCGGRWGCNFILYLLLTCIEREKCILCGSIQSQLNTLCMFVCERRGGWWSYHFHWIPFHEKELVGERRGRTEGLMWVSLT